MADRFEIERVPNSEAEALRRGPTGDQLFWRLGEAWRVVPSSTEPEAESRSMLRMKAHTSGTCPICSREMAAAEPSEDAVERAARALIEREADQMEQDTDGIATLDRWDECDEPTREVYRDEVRFVLAVLP